jgi:hypothetical protein
MQALMILRNLFLSSLQLLWNTFSNELVIHAKQANYFEMFLVAFAVELKNIVVPNLLQLKNILKIIN